MPPVLLFEETYDGEVGDINLSARTPVPGPGGAAEYVGAAGRYRVRPDGHADANGVTASIARYPVPIPVNTTFRIVLDLYREGTDGVAGYFNAHAFCEATAIASWDFLDNLEMQIRRNSLMLTDARMTWKKDPSEPAPAEVNLALAGSISHAPNTGVRYEFEVDEANRIVRIFVATFDTDRATFGLPTDIAPVATGVLSDELAAHLTADRRYAINTTRAASGQVNFRLYKLQVWDMGTPAPPVTGVPCTLLLRVYEDNRTTVLWEVASDPAHAFPYLVEPTNYGAQELDFAAGTASIGTIQVQVVDKAQIAGDQDSGFVTGKLASLGIPAIGGHRCELIRFDPNGSPVVIMDGPATQPVMAGYSAFEWEIQDTRETERKVRCFDVVGPTAPVVDDAAPTGPTAPGSSFGFTWGTEYP